MQMPSLMKGWAVAAPSPLAQGSRGAAPSRGTPSPRGRAAEPHSKSAFYTHFPRRRRRTGAGGGCAETARLAASLLTAINGEVELTLGSLGEISASRETPFLTPTLLRSCRSKKKSPLGLTCRPAGYVTVLGESGSPDALAQHRAGTAVTTWQHEAAAGRRGGPGRRGFSRRRSGSANEALLIQRAGSGGQRSRAACGLLR